MTDETRARLDRAEVLLSLGRSDQALREAGEVLAREPDHLEAGALAARAHLAQGRLHDADVLLQQVVSTHPDAPDALAVLVAVRSAQNRPADALEAAERLREREDSPRARLLHAGALFEARRVEEARATVHEYLAANPDDPSALTLLARAEIQLGRVDLGREALGRALRADPEDLDARRLMALTEDRAGLIAGTADMARAFAAAPDDDDIPVVMEALGSRLLRGPAITLLSTSLAVLVLSIFGAGVFGLHVTTAGGVAAITVVQSIVLLFALAFITARFVRLPARERRTVVDVLRARSEESGAVLLSGWYALCTPILLVIGIVLTATAGDPLGTIALACAVLAASASALVATTFSVAIRRPRLATALVPVALGVAALGVPLILLGGLVMLVLGTVYIVVWAILPKGWLPDIAPPDNA